MQVSTQAIMKVLRNPRDLPARVIIQMRTSKLFGVAEREPILAPLINKVIQDPQPYLISHELTPDEAELINALKFNFPHEYSYLSETTPEALLHKASQLFTGIRWEHEMALEAEIGYTANSRRESNVTDLEIAAVEEYWEVKKDDRDYSVTRDIPEEWDEEDPDCCEWLEANKQFIAAGLARLGYEDLYSVTRKAPQSSS